MISPTHRQQAGLITLSNIVLGGVVSLIATNQIEIDHRYTWVLALLLIVANSRSLWLSAIFNEEDQTEPAST